MFKERINSLVDGGASNGIIADLISDCHGAALAAGWYHDPKTGAFKQLNVGQRLMLCVSEVAEGMEGHRKGLPDDKLPHRSMLEVELADLVIRVCDFAGAEQLNVDETYDLLHHSYQTPLNVAQALMDIVKELANAWSAYQADDRLLLRVYLARTLDLTIRLAGSLELDLGGAYDEKRAFNETRADHKVEARLAAGGKGY